MYGGPADRLEATVELDAPARELSQVDVVTAVLSGHMGVRGEARSGGGQILDGGEMDAVLGSVEKSLQEPPDHVATAIAAGHARAHRDGQVHVATGLVQLLGDLGARLSAADDEHTS